MKKKTRTKKERTCEVELITAIDEAHEESQIFIPKSYFLLFLT